MSVRTKTIVIDIDDTITESDGSSYRYCKVRKGAKEAIDVIRSKFLVVLHTGRHLDKMPMTLKWLKDNNIKYDHIQFGKPPAVLYIDDKGMEFQSWQKTMKSLKARKLWKQ
jgi:hypothetical protein